MKIIVTVDDSDWEVALDRWIAAEEAATLDADMEAAELIGRLTRGYLATFSHPAATTTPSGPGMPPAWITGRLAASVQATMTADSALVGPTSAASSYNGPIGRALELGHTYEAHNATGYMHWFEDGRWHRAREVTHPDHPYLKPMTELAADSGMITEIYARRWAEAQQEAIG